MSLSSPDRKPFHKYFPSIYLHCIFSSNSHSNDPKKGTSNGLIVRRSMFPICACSDVPFVSHCGFYYLCAAQIRRIGPDNVMLVYRHRSLGAKCSFVAAPPKTSSNTDAPRSVRLAQFQYPFDHRCTRFVSSIKITIS